MNSIYEVPMICSSALLKQLAFLLSYTLGSRGKNPTFHGCKDYEIFSFTHGYFLTFLW